MVARQPQPFMKNSYKLNYTPFRSFSALQVDIKSVPGNKAPLLEESPHGRYASVLFSIASTKEILHIVLEDVKQIKEIYKQSEQFRTFIFNSSIRRAEQNAVLTTLYDSLGLNPLTVDFLGTLVDNKRLDVLPKILDKYIEYYRILNKEENITIISAFELNEADRQRVTEALKSSQKGVTFTLKYKIDPAILGGLQMYSGNRFMDCSLASRVAKIKGELAKVSV